MLAIKQRKHSKLHCNKELVITLKTKYTTPTIQQLGDIRDEED